MSSLSLGFPWSAEVIEVHRTVATGLGDGGEVPELSPPHNMEHDWCVLSWCCDYQGHPGKSLSNIGRSL